MINQNLNIDPSDVAIQDCDLCNGGGVIFHAISNEDFDVEICVCIPDDVDISDLVMGM
jgi:hypothetical protein